MCFVPKICPRVNVFLHFKFFLFRHMFASNTKLPWSTLLLHEHNRNNKFSMHRIPSSWIWKLSTSTTAVTTITTIKIRHRIRKMALSFFPFCLHSHTYANAHTYTNGKTVSCTNVNCNKSCKRFMASMSRRTTYTHAAYM